MPTSPFAILDRFLAFTAPEVEGRADQPIPPATLRRLRRFAAGELSAAERERFVKQLERHPEWLIALAEEVKTLRATKPGRAKS